MRARRPLRVLLAGVAGASAVLLADPVMAAELASGVAQEAAKEAAGGSVGSAVPGVPATSVLRLVLGLGLVLALVLALAWAAKRLGAGQGAGNGGIRVLASAPVGQRERVVLLAIGEARILVGVASGRVDRLAELDPADCPAPMETVPFSLRLGEALGAPGRAS